MSGFTTLIMFIIILSKFFVIPRDIIKAFRMHVLTLSRKRPIVVHSNVPCEITKQPLLLSISNLSGNCLHVIETNPRGSTVAIVCNHGTVINWREIILGYEGVDLVIAYGPITRPGCSSGRSIKTMIFSIHKLPWIAIEWQTKNQLLSRDSCLNPCSNSGTPAELTSRVIQSWMRACYLFSCWRKKNLEPYCWQNYYLILDRMNISCKKPILSSKKQ